MARYQAHVQGQQGQIFAHLPVSRGRTPADLLAAEGVSCTTCHQIQEENLDTQESFTGGFLVDTFQPLGQRSIFGPYQVDQGHITIMQSASQFRPTEAAHIQESALCGTCHTLYTHALGPNGEVIGELPEQMPYLEWQHSAYRQKKSCQSCHMPVVESETPITGVLGEPRSGLSRHVFRGGNFFMLRMLNRYRHALGVDALPHELATTARRTMDHLKQHSARIAINQATLTDGRLEIEVAVENQAGHKLPTAYPSRRTWIHLTVQGQGDHTIFESGSIQPNGLIDGNDNDANRERYEPHYETIDQPDQVQIYEAIMVGPEDEVTTGLLTATRFVKDNRILPHGFDKETASPDIAVQGLAMADINFTGGNDRIRYSIPVANARGPFTVTAKFWYQPIAYRWAQNLRQQDAAEIDQFVSYYESMANGVESTGTYLRRVSLPVSMSGRLAETLC